VLSFVREFGDDIVLCVNNLSRFAQPVELDLRPWEGSEPIELLGGTHFPPIGELPYLLTLAGHGFYWLRIPRKPQPTGEPAAVGEPGDLGDLGDLGELGDRAELGGPGGLGEIDPADPAAVRA
jgi:maltose alpha-D-glucosyltransferase/alpha-amylase